MPSDRPTLTQARLKELLHYDPETGHFTWLVCRRNSIKSGAVAGATNGSGYRQISVDSIVYPAHRLAFLYMTGEMPPNDVDHINRVKDDNRWDNLRPATRSQNAANVPIKSNNTSGTTNVHWDTRRRKWQVRHRVAGKRTTYGLFDDLVEASRVAGLLRCSEYGEYVGG